MLKLSPLTTYAKFFHKIKCSTVHIVVSNQILRNTERPSCTFADTAKPTAVWGLNNHEFNDPGIFETETND